MPLLVKKNKKISSNSVRYYFSKNFKKLLSEIDRCTETYFSEDVFSFEKCTIEESDGEFNGSFIDMSEKVGMATYLTKSYILKKYKFEIDNEITELTFDKWMKSKLDDEKFWKENSSEIKIGRLLSKFYVYDEDIETITNYFKALSSDSYEFQIVYGDDIVKYYDIQNQNIILGSNLDESCMGYNSKKLKESMGDKIIAKSLGFYAKVEGLGLLILKKKNSNKIDGRALIWSINDTEKYVDRTYCNEEYLSILYKNYCDKNNFYFYDFKYPKRKVTLDVKDAVSYIASNEDIDLPYLDSFYLNGSKDLILKRY